MRNTCQPITNINVNDSVVGVDGCKGGWLAALWESRRGVFAFEIFPTWECLRQKLKEPRCIAVDMPIGLATSGRRACDQLARKKLGPARASSVFAPPRRPMLVFETYATANEWGKAEKSNGRCGGGLSKQAWNIAPKIREIDSTILLEDQTFIIEAHPELAFQNFNDGHCPDRKKSATGMKQRIDLLSTLGFEGLEQCIERLDKKQASPDDLLDACALAAVAQRKDQGQAQCLCGNPIYDERGLRMEIWY